MGSARWFCVALQWSWDADAVTHRSLKGHRTRYAIGVLTRKGQWIHCISSGSRNLKLSKKRRSQMAGQNNPTASTCIPKSRNSSVRESGPDWRVACFSRMRSFPQTSSQKRSRTVSRPMSDVASLSIVRGNRNGLGCGGKRGGIRRHWILELSPFEYHRSSPAW